MCYTQGKDFQDNNKNNKKQNQQKQKDLRQQQNEKLSNDFKVINKRNMFTGNWLNFYSLDFKLQDRMFFNYEAIERVQKKNKTINVDGVTILGIISYVNPNKKNKLVFISQFRPPLGKFTLELPCGLLENNNVFQEAQRELREETGYVSNGFYGSTITELTADDNLPNIYSDPSVMNSCGKFVLMNIDGDDERNIHPKQELNEDEEISVHLVEIDSNLVKNVQELAVRKNLLIVDKVWLFCMGLVCSELMKNYK